MIASTFSPAISISLIKSLEWYILLQPFAIAVKYGEVLMMQKADVSKRCLSQNGSMMQSFVCSSIAYLALLKMETIASSLKQSKN